ncbi:putative oxidoreductase [Enterobacter sp. BIGb0383]|uniref:DoxX family membrane protein n=1 Tax=unclassified Enterobacter TaxID=2608935 RepID=UPI000F48DF76|nr:MULTISPECIES: DoxX family protein [unclassified Enterobacter]ROP61833.1 putative oxidoreductase [Enterobacter sp. BIGb0383]ROS11994.1 putative oxidoreductase [Enterobacter sp. BIGb0359]
MDTRTIMIIARILITPLFLYSGTGKLFNFTDNVLKTPFGDSLIGRLMIIAAIIIEIGGSIAFISGYKIKETSLLWILYVFLTSVMFHQFWAASGAQQVSQIVQFTKNMSICAGLLSFYLYSRDNLKDAK